MAEVSAPARYQRVDASSAPVLDPRRVAQTILMNGLFDCFEDCLMCLAACWCSPCLAGKVAERSGLGPCFLWGICYWIAPSYIGAYITTALERASGAEAPQYLDRCCEHFCCPVCAIARDARASAFLAAAPTATLAPAPMTRV